MQISISGHQLDVTDALKQYVEEKLGAMLTLKMGKPWMKLVVPSNGSMTQVYGAEDVE